MKCLGAVVLVVAALTVGCSSTTPPIKAKNDQADPNKKHWEGTTGVLKNYRLPGKSSR
jgi:hypothetical protein